jgi:hypothetical protein
VTTSGIPDPASRAGWSPATSAGGLVWFFLASGCFSTKTPVFERLIFLDFLGFSRPKPVLSMGYTRFSVENFYRPFRPVEAPDLASVIGEGVIAHRASLRCLLFFCKELSRELCPVGRADLKAPPSRPPSTRAVDHIHSSRSPALRSPSARAGGIAKRSVSIFTVSLGLARSASARTDFASSILPWSA